MCDDIGKSMMRQAIIFARIKVHNALSMYKKHKNEHKKKMHQCQQFDGVPSPIASYIWGDIIGDGLHMSCSQINEKYTSLLKVQKFAQNVTYSIIKLNEIYEMAQKYPDLFL
jgi:hypothetical protein